MTVAEQERPLSVRAAYSARPTVRVDGAALRLVNESVRTCVVAEAEGGLSTLTLGLSNWGVTDGGIGLLFDAGGAIAIGSRLTVQMGDREAPAEVFRGEVHAIEARASVGAPPELVVLAEDALFAARMARRSAVYADQSLDDIVRAVAGRLGLRVGATDLPGGSATHAQLNESDLAFLRRLLARHDADLQVVGDELHAAPAAAAARGEIEMTLYSQLQQVRVIADVAQQCTEVTAGGFDVEAGRAFSASSRGAHLGPGSGRSGAALLQPLAERSEHLMPLACRDEAEARALADAAFDQRARRFVRLHGRSEGNAALRVGSTVRVSGLGRRFDNRYAVIEARHAFDTAEGYRTEFVAQSAYLAEA
jgi:phage protein D